MRWQIFLLAFCFLWGTFIAVRDLQTFRVRNSSVLWGLCLIWPAFYFLGEKFHLTLTSSIVVALFVLAGLNSVMGMGDVKLFLIFAPWLHEANLLTPFFLLIGTTWLQLVVIWMVTLKLPKRIAFAPAILLAAALNMAT